MKRAALAAAFLLAAAASFAATVASKRAVGEGLVPSSSDLGTRSPGDRKGRPYGASTAAVPARSAKKTPVPRRLDFSGTWRLDPKLSVNVSPRMERAVLIVSQKGDRIWISPGRPKMAVMAEEIVADGKQYEKALGNGGSGVVTAAWADDGKSLRLEVSAGDVVQRSIWKLSSDGSVWVRETNTIDHGARRSSRLVFRKESPTGTK